ncbi:2-haloalkanoic acid dehalogenase [Vibrio sp. UCD-FRSSP16_10]|uniref:HAD-IA family hydrolase n=1 Tax=unclassified Vibrio TaxID=2614977 RepID=UPI0008023948|nr:MULTISPECIES: HAD-IA family hydrolase [unclassified Vibrio]OBT10203.1 2-haloalkanoic acid dehalogenase [Vibrio sp. UCD-FRSSP16_30]OBT18993.1 2-haloalkanoic acid dehalogenase [Vibrio sp. UCD-FRSSP16_10]
MRFYRSLNPIQAMTFDLDDTLYDNHPVIRRLERDLRHWINQTYPKLATLTESDWKAFKQQALQSSERCRHDVTVARETQLGFAFSSVDIIGSSQIEAIKQTMEQVTILRNRVDIPELTFKTLDALLGQIPLIAITNGNVDIERIGLQPYFTATLKAGPDGAAKPNSDMFVQAANILQLPAHSILHVGDHLVTDVLGAKASGFQAAWFNNSSIGIKGNQKAKIMPDVEISRIDQLLHFI